MQVSQAERDSWLCACSPVHLPLQCNVPAPGCAGCVAPENTRRPEFSGKTLVRCSLDAQEDGDDDGNQGKAPDLNGNPVQNIQRTNWAASNSL